ncbi:MAG: RICIN domain-containing protein [Verrucomicrobiota bacterium]
MATVTLDASGNGSFVFPANSYPKGPITLRLIAGSDASKADPDVDTDTCHLQLYNTGGVSWKEGLAAAPTPAQAASMALAWADDFDSALSISRTGAGATYGSHTIGYKDFSGLRFRDYETSKNPFLQKDTYLRIRAYDPVGTANDWNDGGTGLICSIGQDKTGFKVQVPFYAECRFIAQRAIGTWPAFWLLSLQGSDSEYGEIDVIEAYGNVTQSRYTAGSHRWPSSIHDHDYKLIKMDGSIAGTVNADWSDTVHTYGVKVTSSTTTFYLDDVEVYSQPTRSAWITQDWYFLVNYAIGGTSGWPYDLSRYGQYSDMYVDWVRVYQGGSEEIVVDNSDSTGVSITGSWTSSSFSPDYIGTNYLHDGNSGKGSKSVTFTPTVPSTGNYEVSVFYNSSVDRANNVPVDVVHANGTENLSVDQTTGGGDWVSLGIYEFNAGTGGSVTVGNTGTTKHVVADAIRLVPTSQPAIPATAKIVNSYTGKALRPLNDGTGNNVNIVQYAYSGSHDQDWEVNDLGTGYHTIVNVDNGKALRPYNGGTLIGDDIVQYTDYEWQSQQFELIDVGGGLYRIKNRHSGHSLRPDNAGTADNVQIVQRNYSDWASMKWEIVAP